MSKYSEEELSAMAQSLQTRKTVDPMSYRAFMVVMGQVTGLSFKDIEEKVEALIKEQK